MCKRITPLLAMIASVASLAVAVPAQAGVVQWGSNFGGRLCDGSTVGEQMYSSVPVGVAGIGEVKAVAHGYSDTIFLMPNGHVETCGSNAYNQLGVSKESVFSTTSPIEVPGLTEVVEVAAEANTGLALKSNGEVIAWGMSTNGEAGSWEFFTLPHRVPGLGIASHIGAGTMMGYAIVGGKVYGWGNDQFYGLGREIPSMRTATPLEVEGVSHAAKVVGGGVFAADLSETGGIQSWGLFPPSVTGNFSAQVKDIAAGWSDLIGLTREGQVYQAGGFPALTNTQPNLVVNHASAIGADYYVGEALIEKGPIETWGSNETTHVGEILGTGEVGGPEVCEGFGFCSREPRVVGPLTSPATSLAAGAALGATAPGPTIYSFPSGKLTGTMSGSILAPSVLSGTFVGGAALHGDAHGTASFTAAITFHSLHLKVPLTIKTDGAFDALEGSFSTTELNLDGFSLPVKCKAIVRMGFDVPQNVSESGFSVSSSVTPKWECERGGSLEPGFENFLINMLLGKTISTSITVNQ